MCASNEQSQTEAYNHWGEMKQWHECMVNPKTRRVRLSVLAQLAYVPPNFPRLRNALFRLAYTGKAPTAEQIRNGLVFLKTLNSLSHMKDQEFQSVFQIAEEVLHQWHVTYAELGAYSHMTQKIEAALWAQVDPRLVSCISKNPKST